MRIGIDARLWNETGVGRYIRNLVYALQELDTENEYILFVYGNTFSDSNLKNKEKWRIVKTEIRWHTFAEQFKFPQILEKENLDLMHFPYFSVPVNYKRPYIVTVHDLIIYHIATGKASTLPLPVYHVKRLGYKYILRKAVANAKKIIVPLESVKKDLQDTLHIDAQRIVVTVEGVDLSLRAQRSNLYQNEIASQPSIVRNDRYFLYVGNAYPHKNVETLIDAFKAFHSEYKHYKLYLVGKEDYFYNRLVKKVQHLALDNVVQFKEHVSDERLAELYQHATAFISVSLMEGFGLPPLEALANYCPVILSDIPAFREVCDDAALYVEPQNKKDIIEKMRIAAEMSEQSRKKLLAAGEKRVAKYSWEKMARQTLEVYESVD